MWLLWQLFSNQKKGADNNFEYRLILEYEDKPPLDIDINLSNEATEVDQWLRLMRIKAPFSDDNIPNKEKVSFCISGFIDLNRLLKKEPKLSNIYLWASTSEKSEPIYVETKLFAAGCSFENPKTRSLNASKNFIELYSKSPQQKPSERYEQIEEQRIDSEGVSELIALIRGEDSAAIITESSRKPPVVKRQRSKLKVNIKPKDDIKNLFSKQDFKDLVDGFNEWQRSRGRKGLIDKLPESLVNKMGEDYAIAFWSSGQGISNMVRDDNPPRHTMVISIIHKSSKEGYGYCIRRPTSLDRVWAHKKWHKIKYSDNEILEVSALEY